VERCEDAETARRLAWKQPSFKKCVTAYWPNVSSRGKCKGAQAATRSYGIPPWAEMGRGASSAQRSWSGSTGGARPSENAGMSSDNTGENPVRRKPKVSPAMFVRRRLGGPKARPEGVADGQQVEIPAPAAVRWMTLRDTLDRPLVVLGRALRGKAVRVDRGREKLLKLQLRSTVLQTDTGR
jgi:hypothetical protein